MFAPRITHEISTSCPTPQAPEKGALGAPHYLVDIPVFTKKGQYCLRNSHDEDRTKTAVVVDLTAIVSVTTERARTGTTVVVAAPTEPSI